MTMVVMKGIRSESQQIGWRYEAMDPSSKGKKEGRKEKEENGRVNVHNGGSYT